MATSSSCGPERTSRALRSWLGAAALGALWLACASTPAPAPTPKLVVLISVDQLRAAMLDPNRPGGLGTLARQGRLYTRAFVDHAGSETCPGHAALATGRHPGAAGVPANDFIDPATGSTVYCVNDAAPDAAVLGGKNGRSPRLIRVSALGDWLKAAQPRAHVFAVSAKDRSAIALGGQHPDGAYWLQSDPPLGFTTSRYYRSALPDWVQSFNGERGSALLQRAPQTWEHETSRPGLQPDDFPAETARLSRTSGHPIQNADPARALDQLYRTPFVDAITLDFTRELVETEKLGLGPAPDLLLISLSATDTVGHLYGPDSQEAADNLERLDRALGQFLSWLENRVGRERLLVALSADHGVLSLPEWLAQQGKSECPVKGGRIDEKALYEGLAARLSERFPPAEPRWFDASGLDLTFHRETLARRSLDLAAVRAEAESFLEQQPGIASAWNADEIRSGASPVARLYRNSFDPERSADLSLEPRPTCLVTRSTEGTTHGSPNEYDRAVPVLFYGNAVPAARVDEAVATVDVAPSLAARLGLAVPTGLDGRDLLNDPR